MLLHLWWGGVILLSLLIVVGGIGLFAHPTSSLRNDKRSVVERWLDQREARRERDAREAREDQERLDRLLEGDS